MTSTIDIEKARRSLFFNSLPMPVFDVIAAKSSVVSLSPNQTLFNEGEDAEALFAVLDGQVKLTVGRRDGSEVVVETFQAGASFAEAIVFERNRYPVTATALEPTRIFVAPGSVVRKAIKEEPDAFDAILAATYRHLHRLVHQIEQLKSDTSLERLARYILMVSHQVQPGESFEFPIEKQVVASLLGMKPETLSRSLKRLGQYGVEAEGRRMKITNAKALTEFLDSD